MQRSDVFRDALIYTVNNHKRTLFRVDGTFLFKRRHTMQEIMYVYVDS